ncbi:MAG: carbohydrate binding domain-containing protein [Brevinematales bacterium]|jgi:hypothetical protein
MPKSVNALLCALFIIIYASCGVKAGVERLGADIIKTGDFPDGSVADFPSGTGPQWALLQKAPGEGHFETAGGVCKVVPDKPGSDPSLLTLAYSPCPVGFGKAYRVSFEVRADSKRSILVRVGRTGGDRLSYSGLKSFDVAPDWQAISFVFKSLATDDMSRFEFQCANEKPPLYFRKVSLRPVLE